MKNRRLLLIFVIITCFPFIATSCSNQKDLKPDTPANTAIVMESFLKAGNYKIQDVKEVPDEMKELFK